MFGWDEAQSSYDQSHQNANQDPDNQATLSHEVIAGGAAFGAMKLWEDQQRKEGKPIQHQFAKEALVGLAGVEVDRLCEMNGADYIDRERAKKQAAQQSTQLYDQQYGGNDNYDPNNQQPHDSYQRYSNN